MLQGNESTSPIGAYIEELRDFNLVTEVSCKIM